MRPDELDQHIRQAKREREVLQRIQLIQETRRANRISYEYIADRLGIKKYTLRGILRLTNAYLPSNKKLERIEQIVNGE